MNSQLKEAFQNFENEGHRVLYFVKFGSHLYGTENNDPTNGPLSDTDYKGLFLPSRESCILGTPPKHFTWTSGNKKEKNSHKDIDVQLWSLQYFLQMVQKGETNAIDLLYSFTYPEIIIFDSGELKYMFDNHSSLFDAKNCNAYCGYAIGQAKKYGVKGSRMGVIKRVLRFLQHNHYDDFQTFPHDTLNTIINSLIENCGDESYCFVKELKGSNGEMKPYLVLCGSKHDLTIRIEEFYKRVKNTFDTYGERAAQAEENQGLDFKALSHAMRAIYQMQELLVNGKIQYPLNTAPQIKTIKSGKLTWKEIEPMIVNGLEKVNKLQETSTINHKYDEKVHHKIILSFY